MLVRPAAARALSAVSASAGNHAPGLAYRGQLLGGSVTVVVPGYVPLIKITMWRRLGARVVEGDFAEAVGKRRRASRRLRRRVNR